MSPGIYVITDHWGGTVASLEERVYKAEVIVRARLLSAANDVLRFRSVRYVKGTGPSEFDVRAETDGRDTQWDNQDAILFLVPLIGETEDFEFVDSTTWDYVTTKHYVTEYSGDLPEGYTLGTRNPVWLPVEESAGEATRSAASDGGKSDGDIISEYAHLGGNPVTVSQTDLQSTVQWANGSSGAVPAAEGKQSTGSKTPSYTAEEYRQCVKSALFDIRLWRDLEHDAGKAFEAPTEKVQTESGLASGTVIESYSIGSIHDKYSGSEVFGADADLFLALEVDDDDDGRWYYHEIHTIRPLPEGTYMVNHRTKDHFFRACDFQMDEIYIIYEVRVTAPDGTVHEALFDPATTTAAVKPATFNVGATSTTIERVAYASSTVTLNVSPAGALAGHDLEFIAQDGTIALTLDPDSVAASSTLTFALTSAPWAAGDKMMLRVRKDIPPPLLDTTFTAGRADIGSNWVTGYYANFVGSIANAAFTVGDTATAVDGVLWFDRYPEGEVRLGLTTAVDLSNYMLRFSAASGTEILVLDGGAADEVSNSGAIYEWTVGELPWAAGDTVTLRIRQKE